MRIIFNERCNSFYGYIRGCSLFITYKYPTISESASKLLKTSMRYHLGLNRIAESYLNIFYTIGLLRIPIVLTRNRIKQIFWTDVNPNNPSHDTTLETMYRALSASYDEISAHFLRTIRSKSVLWSRKQYSPSNKRQY